jgi:hypothetical protein
MRSLHDLAEGLSANQLVVDETGILGIYDFEVALEYEAGPPADEPVERRVEFQSSLKAAFEKQAGLIVNLGRLVKRPLAVYLRAETVARLVLRWLLDVVDDQKIDRSFCRFQL